MPQNDDATVPRLRRGSKVLVTGATGFIGGRLVERLLEHHDAEVRCTIRDINRTGRLRSVELVQVDLCNADDVNRAVNGIDYVFHCAYDWQSRRQNINGLRNIVNACLANSVDRLVHVSTFAVYLPCSEGPITEDSPDGDRWDGYVDTKLDLEKIVFEATGKRGLAATIIQPTIVYGPFGIAWTNIPANQLAFGDVIIPDGGHGICNAVYIDDLVDGMFLAALSPVAIGERFLMSGPTPVTWGAFYTEMARPLAAKPPTFWPREMIENSNRESYTKCLIKYLIKLVAHWKPARLALRAGRKAISERLRKVMGSSRVSNVRNGGREVFLPNRERLAFYCSTATVGSEKACLKLGYRPRFDFQSGMTVTGRYLKSRTRQERQYGLSRQPNEH
jgi:nucleoside-diphosphate-sugar epimerase